MHNVFIKQQMADNFKFIQKNKIQKTKKKKKKIFKNLFMHVQII